MVSATLVALWLSAAPAPAAWPGTEMPLPVSVRTPEDLSFKAALEKEYLEFNLLGAGKLAYDKGDWDGAVAKWEALLKVPGLPAEIDALVRPLLLTARSKSGKAGGELPPPPKAQPALPAQPSTTYVPPAPQARAVTVSVGGMLSGGGRAGPGGAVVFLKRANGSTPKPRPARARVIEQKDKKFVPRVLAVPVGTPVEFKNVDPVFHNVFSLSRPNDFDLGLYKSGVSKDHAFSTPGAVQLLCNIHSSMLGWVFVVDSPWFAQADADGGFVIRGVPPGEYRLTVWHENSSKMLERTVKVTADGAEPIALSIDADKSAPAFVPDKAGKPRQPQLGY
jgi:plastocyanin